MKPRNTTSFYKIVETMLFKIVVPPVASSCRHTNNMTIFSYRHDMFGHRTFDMFDSALRKYLKLN